MANIHHSQYWLRWWLSTLICSMCLDYTFKNKNTSPRGWWVKISLNLAVTTLLLLTDDAIVVDSITVMAVTDIVSQFIINHGCDCFSSRYCHRYPCHRYIIIFIVFHFRYLCRCCHSFFSIIIINIIMDYFEIWANHRKKNHNRPRAYHHNDNS